MMIIAQIILTIFLPLLMIGIIRKLKALFQNRTGPNLFQPYFNLFKLLKKSQVISQDSSFVFIISPIISLGLVIFLSFLLPWLPFNKSVFESNIFLVVYLLALLRFLTIISAIDTGSPFSSFSTSKEVTFAVLLEPAVILSFLALAIFYKNTNLFYIFSSNQTVTLNQIPVFILFAMSLFLTSIVEFSRAPVDDPNTHLELTMIHEAMILENSGLNLAIVEYTYSLKLLLFLFLMSSALAHCLLIWWHLSVFAMTCLTVFIVFLLLILLSFIEVFTVKLSFNKIPNFIAYALTFSFLAVFSAIVNRS